MIKYNYCTNDHIQLLKEWKNDKTFWNSKLGMTECIAIDDSISYGYYSNRRRGILNDIRQRWVEYKNL